MKIFFLLTFAAYAFADCRNGKSLDGDVKGMPATVLALPSTVSLEFKNKHFCSGAAVAKQYAVTAARCVVGVNAQDLSIRSGSASSALGGNKHEVEEIIVHPDYNSATLDYNIAIIKVTKSKKFSSTISMASSKPVLLTSASTYGWPLKSSLMDPWVRHVTAPLVSSKTCASTYGITLGDSMLCAGLSTKTQCQGDTGSPLVSNSKLIGIASFGYGCTKSAPGVYTSIPQVRKWIKGIVD